MTDVHADDRPEDEDRLPWLEAVEDEERGPSPLKLIAAVLIGLVAIGIVVGGLFWLGNRGGAGADEELIASPGDYKVRPPEAGGMRVDNSSATQVATSEGTQPQARINPNAAPEAPVTQPQQPARPPQTQPPAAQPPQARPAAQPQPQPSRPTARPAGPTIQVGAFPSEAVANSEWARLVSRYPYIGTLQRSITVYQRGNQTFYRLRASGGEASAVCRRLRSAGQPCMDVN